MSEYSTDELHYTSNFGIKLVFVTSFVREVPVGFDYKAAVGGGGYACPLLSRTPFSGIRR